MKKAVVSALLIVNLTLGAVFGGFASNLLVPNWQNKSETVHAEVKLSHYNYKGEMICKYLNYEYFASFTYNISDKFSYSGRIDGKKAVIEVNNKEQVADFITFDYVYGKNYASEVTKESIVDGKASYAIDFEDSSMENGYYYVGIYSEYDEALGEYRRINHVLILKDESGVRFVSEGAPSLKAMITKVSKYDRPEFGYTPMAFRNDAITKKAKELTKNCKTNYDRAKAIYTWITENISFYSPSNTDFSAKKANLNNPVWAFQNGCAYGQGFAQLFATMCHSVNIPAVCIGGSGEEMASYLNKSIPMDHYWNLIYVNGKWCYADPQYDAKYAKKADGTKEETAILGPDYFCQSVGYFALSHIAFETINSCVDKKAPDLKVACSFSYKKINKKDVAKGNKTYNLNPKVSGAQAGYWKYMKVKASSKYIALSSDKKRLTIKKGAPKGTYTVTLFTFKNDKFKAFTKTIKVVVS